MQLNNKFLLKKLRQKLLFNIKQQNIYIFNVQTLSQPLSIINPFKFSIVNINHSFKSEQKLISKINKQNAYVR